MTVFSLEHHSYSEWNMFVAMHPDSNIYHLAGWKNIIENTYGHKTYYLICTKSGTSEISKKLKSRRNRQGILHLHETESQVEITGILPLVHLKHFLLGNTLISIPFFDFAGILYTDMKAAEELIQSAFELAGQLGARSIELRHSCAQPILGENRPPLQGNFVLMAGIGASPKKVRMVLELPETSEILFDSFKSKLKSQIRKPIKENLYCKTGGTELIDDFYKVFSKNMRDLGSPVHSRRMISNVLEEFSDKSRVFVVYKDGLPLACSLVVGFKDILENPWASSLREYSRLSPNMLLYYRMLEYACENNFRYFDFGRSTPGEGTYKFKEQWGAKPQPLFWYSLRFDEKPKAPDLDKSKFEKMIALWQKLPVPIANLLGPRIRKNIGL